ncbi:MFS transporter [uncultured Bifidobacterium sp.]|uniref:MFS transporter n=1 Tax=uncultured Bifidobacterium sp. TaxID=165187 RepID=UPI002613DD60|nr:MFS transporter [uncultured Bifidobacterium sp.]
MVATPMMYDAMGMEGMLHAMGWLAMIVGLPAVLLLRERPDRPAGPGADETGGFSMRDAWGLRRNHNFVILLLIVMISLGAFNAVLTCLSDMLLARGIDSERAGVVGAVVIVAGIVGGVVYPLLSDRAGRRRPFIILATVASLPSLAGLFFLGSYPVLLVCAAVAVDARRSDSQRCPHVPLLMEWSLAWFRWRFHGRLPFTPWLAFPLM